METHSRLRSIYCKGSQSLIERSTMWHRRGWPPPALLRGLALVLTNIVDFICYSSLCQILNLKFAPPIDFLPVVSQPCPVETPLFRSSGKGRGQSPSLLSLCKSLQKCDSVKSLAVWRIFMRRIPWFSRAPHVLQNNQKRPERQLLSWAVPFSFCTECFEARKTIHDWLRPLKVEQLDIQHGG